MTAEELKKQLENDLLIVRQYLEIKHRREGLTSSHISALTSAEHGANGSHAGGAAYGKIGPAVIMAIKHCRKRYDVREIHKVLQKLGQKVSKGQIATALRRFERQGKIKEVEHGSGRRPNKYTTITSL